MEFEAKNNNVRWYSRDIATKRILNEKILDDIKNKRLVGELNHPKERFEVDYNNACICTTSLYLDEDDLRLKGTFDILNTPQGKIVDLLLRYGTHIGLSARALGETVDTKRGKEVVVDSYTFKTFDVVSDPGFSIATVNPKDDKLNENIDNEVTLKDALISLYESFDCDTLENVKPIYESLGFTDDSLNNNVVNQEASQGCDDKPAKESSIEPLGENEDTKGDNTNEYDSIIEMYENLLDTLGLQYDNTLSELESNKQSLKLVQESSNYYKRLLEEANSKIENLTESLKTANSKILSLNESMREKDIQINTLKYDVFEAENSIEVYEQDREELINSYEKAISEMDSNYDSLFTDYKKLEEELNEANQKVYKLNSLNENVAEISKEDSEDFTLLGVINESNNQVPEKVVDVTTDKLLSIINKNR